MNDTETLIKIEDCGKIFCRDLKKSLWYGTKDAAGDLLPLFHRKSDQDGLPKLRSDEFWANKGVSFEVKRGECVGLIGHNGAGKTTLLKMLNGLIKPNTGHIEMRGRVGAMIALGAGFNGVLTARENIFINGAVLGIPREVIEERFDDIIDFAELEEFVDTPVQNFSSGMQVKLGFSIATSFEPDILLLDEVLAVGDSGFKQKCLIRISKLLEKAAVIFVSHTESQIKRICNKVVWLKKGEIYKQGDTNELLEEYIISMKQHRPSALVIDKKIIDVIPKASIMQEKVEFGENLDIHVIVTQKVHLETPTFTVGIVSNAGEVCAQSITQTTTFSKLHEQTHFVICLKQIRLKTGVYSINLNLTSKTGKLIYFKWDSYHDFEIINGVSAYSDYVVDAECRIET